MTMFRMEGRWVGLDKVMAKLDADNLLDDPLNDFLTDSVLHIEAGAKRNAPTSGAGGGIRQNITHEVDKGKKQGRVGTNKNYAVYVHGAFDEKKKRTRPHFPPLDPLRTWAQRHGIPVFAVALAIARRGTPFVPFLSMAMKDSESFIKDRVRRLGDDIAGRFH